MGKNHIQRKPRKVISDLCLPWYDNNTALLHKICSKYQDMLLRPRLVCHEPGLRPIGRSPVYLTNQADTWVACPGILHRSWFAGLPPCTVLCAIVHCNQNRTDHQTIKSPSMPCWGAVLSRNYAVFFNQYLLMVLTSLNVSYSRFRKLVMFWMWRHHDMA